MYAHVVADTGSIDLAQLVTACAGLITAVGWAYTQIRTHSTVKKIDQSVGVTNGSDLAATAARLVRLERYTHDSIEAMREMLTPVAALAPHDPDLLTAAVANRIAERAATTVTGTPVAVAERLAEVEAIAARSRADHSQV